ncbi:glycosyltransferase family 39 protein [Candidatus Gottesmanbacteria bacterium]|nr:glycosyltransferase family 39 protein [Candidatus Gottesmanbacteria bacterium]
MRLDKILIGIFFFLVVGLVIRLIPVVNDTVHFGFDQGLDIILTKQLVADHKFNLVSRYSGLQGVLMGPLWTWFLAVPFAISGGNPAANVVWLAFLSVVSSLVTYFIVRKILGKTIGVITFLFSLFAPYFVTNSQIILSPHPLTYLFIFYLWFVYEISVYRRKIFWVPLGLLLGIFFQLEIAFAVPALLAVLFLVSPFNKQTLWGIIIFGLTFIPQLLFDLRHDFLITKSLFSFIGSGSNSLYHEVPPLMTRFALRIRSFWEDFWIMTLGTTVFPVLTGGLILMFWGWWTAIRNKDQKALWTGKTALVIILSFYFAFSFYPGAIWGWYRQGLPIVYLLFLTIPLGILWNKFVKLRLFLFLGGIYLLFIFINPLEIRNKVGGLGEQKQILDYIYNSSQNQGFSYYAYTPPVYDYIWQYNFWWYGQKKYRYLPKNWQMGVPLLGIGTQSLPPNKNTGLFYLIIEPDSERPWAPNGWKESYIKIGRTLESKTFANGVIVEKRTTF